LRDKKGSKREGIGGDAGGGPEEMCRNQLNFAWRSDDFAYLCLRQYLGFVSG